MDGQYADQMKMSFLTGRKWLEQNVSGQRQTPSQAWNVTNSNRRIRRRHYPALLYGLVYCALRRVAPFHSLASLRGGKGV